MSSRTEIKGEKTKSKKRIETINDNKNLKSNRISNKVATANSIFLGKKLLNFRPPKKELEEESLSIRYISDESQSFLENTASNRLNKNNRDAKVNPNNNTNNCNSGMINKTDKQFLLNAEAKQKNNTVYNLALAYNEKHILEELKRSSVFPLNNINNAKSLYNQKILLNLIKGNPIKNTINPKNDENFFYDNFHSNFYNCYTNLNLNYNEYLNHFKNSNFEDELNEDDINCRYTSTYRDKIINKIKKMPNKEIIDESLAELQSDSKSIRDTVNNIDEYPNQNNYTQNEKINTIEVSKPIRANCSNIKKTSEKQLNKMNTTKNGNKLKANNKKTKPHKPKNNQLCEEHINNFLIKSTDTCQLKMNNDNTLRKKQLNLKDIINCEIETNKNVSMFLADKIKTTIGQPKKKDALNFTEKKTPIKNKSIKKLLNKKNDTFKLRTNPNKKTPVCVRSFKINNIEYSATFSQVNNIGLLSNPVDIKNLKKLNVNKYKKKSSNSRNKNELNAKRASKSNRQQNNTFFVNLFNCNINDIVSLSYLPSKNNVTKNKSIISSKINNRYTEFSSPKKTPIRIQNSSFAVNKSKYNKNFKFLDSQINNIMSMDNMSLLKEINKTKSNYCDWYYLKSIQEKKEHFRKIQEIKELQRRNKEKSKQKYYALRNEKSYKMQLRKKTNSKIQDISRSEIKAKFSRKGKSTYRTNLMNTFLEKKERNESKRRVTDIIDKVNINMSDLKKKYCLTLEKDDDNNSKRKLEIKFIGTMVEDDSVRKEEFKTESNKKSNNAAVSSKENNNNIKYYFTKIMISEKNKKDKNKRKIEHKTITKRKMKNKNESNVTIDKGNIKVINSIVGINDSSYLVNSSLYDNNNDKINLEKRDLSKGLNKLIYKRKSVSKGRRSFYKKNNSFAFEENNRIFNTVFKNDKI